MFLTPDMLLQKPFANSFPGSYPFQEVDPFVLEACPHIFFAGSQPSFKTTLIEDIAPLSLNGGDTEMTDNGNNSPTRVRLLSIPRFQKTGELVLVDTETLEVEVVRFGAFAGQEEKK
jgi:DNA polymerase delta subunit 2